MKIKTTYCLVLLLLLMMTISRVNAQGDSTSLYSYNLIELSKININSASKTPQEYRKVPASIAIITARQIKENGYFTIDQALANLPGFQFRDIQGFNNYVFQRGIPNQNNLVLVLIDGVQVNELNSGGFYSGGQFNMDNVERIEVIYGPVSAMYGTNAFSGIINIITKNNDGLSASMLTGSFNTYNMAVNYGYKKDDFSASVAGMYKTTEKADLTGNNNDNNWSEQMENFETDYAFDAKLNYKNFSAGLNLMDKQASRTTSFRSVGTVNQEQGTLWDIIFANTYLKYNKTLNDKLHVSANLYNRNATVRNNTVTQIIDTTQIGFYRPNNLTGVEATINYSSLKKKLNIVAGVNFEKAYLAEGFSKTYSDSKDKKPAAPERPKMLDNTLLSVYAQGEFYVIPQLALVAGARFDNSSYYNQVLTPRASAVFNTKFSTAKLIYAKAFRAPRPWDYTNGIGNPNLQPEHINSFEVVNHFYINKNIALRLNVYKNMLDGSFTKETDAGTGDFRWVNQGKLETDGVEASIRYSSQKFNFYTNYTYNYTTDEVTKTKVAEIATHTLNSGITYRYSNVFVFNLTSNYLGARKNPKVIAATGDDIINPAFVLNGSLSYTQLENINFQLIVKNILDEEYYHTSNLQPDRYRQPQRTIMLKVSYNIVTNE